jgi:hypothetical protein
MATLRNRASEVFRTVHSIYGATKDKTHLGEQLLREWALDFAEVQRGLLREGGEVHRDVEEGQQLRELRRPPSGLKDISLRSLQISLCGGKFLCAAANLFALRRQTGRAHVRDEAGAVDVRVAPDGVEHVGGDGHVQHLFDGHAADEVRVPVRRPGEHPITLYPATIGITNARDEVGVPGAGVLDGVERRQVERDGTVLHLAQRGGVSECKPQ